MMNSFTYRLTQSLKRFTVLATILIALCLSLAIATSSAMTPKAYAQYEAAPLHAQANQMSASTTSVSMVPRQTTINNGYKYYASRKTVTIYSSINATHSVSTSDYQVATAEWSSPFKNGVAHIRITGHTYGNATITVSNKATSEKIQIQVSVGMGDVAVHFNNPYERTFTKKDGTNGYYRLANFTLSNGSPKTLTVNKACTFKIWTRANSNLTGRYVKKGSIETIRSMPVKIASGKSKRVCYGEKQYIDANGKPLEDDPEYSYFAKMAFTLRVNGSYRTYYVDKYGMVAMMHFGKDF